MRQITTELLDRLTAQQNISVTLAYGRHLVAGNVILRDHTTNDIGTGGVTGDQKIDLCFPP